MFRIQGFVLVVTSLTFSVVPMNAYAYDSASITRSIPCSKIESMFKGVNPGSFLHKAFVDTYIDILPADQWTTEAFNNFAGRSISCFADSAMLRFSAQVGLKAMAASFQETLQQRQEQADNRRQQAIAADVRHKAALQEVETALSAAEAHSGTAIDAYNGVEAIKTALGEPHLTEAERGMFALRLAALVRKRNGLIEKETASLAAQQAAQKERADAEDAEIAKLEELNRQKEAAQATDKARKQRLAAVQSKAAELAARDQTAKDDPLSTFVNKLPPPPVSLDPAYEEKVSNRRSDGSTPRKAIASTGLAPKPPEDATATDKEAALNEASSADIDQKTKEVFLDNKAGTVIMVAQLFLKRNCPMFKINEAMMSSIDQSKNDIKIKSPEAFTEKESTVLLKFVEKIEKGSKDGLIPGSPIDIEMKCNEFGSLLIGTGMYQRVD